MDATRAPEVVFEQTRRLQWAIWQVLTERFHLPEGLRYTLCEELALDLYIAGAFCDE